MEEEQEREKDIFMILVNLLRALRAHLLGGDMRSFQSCDIKDKGTRNEHLNLKKFIRCKN